MTGADTHDLTASQLLIWLGMQRHPEAPIYNMVMTFRIAAALDPAHFATAFTQVVARSDALRSVFIDTSGRPQRRTRPVTDHEIDFLDLSPEANVETSFQSWLQERSRRLLDVGLSGFDTVLIKLGASDFAWYLNLHHLITDAWSSRLVYEQVAEQYGRLQAGQATGIAANGLPANSFQNCIEELHKNEESPRHQAALEFWQDRAAATRLLEPLEIYGRSITTDSTVCERVSLNLDAAVTARIAALITEKSLRSLNRDVTLFQLFATVLFALLHRASAQSTLVIGAPALNRTTATQRETIGLLMEMFSLHAIIEPQETLASLYTKVQTETVNFFRHSRTGVSNAKLLKGFGVLLNFVRGFFPEFDGARVSVDYVHAGHAEPHNALRVQIRDLTGSGQLAIDFDFNSEVFAGSTRSIFIDQFLAMLDAFCGQRDRAIADIDLLSAAQRHMLLGVYNETTAAYSSELALHERFSAWAQQQPEQTAVTDDGQSLTYRELDQHSNRLAHALLAEGVRPGDRVALVMDRSVNFVIGVLATLKAGAAYLPIDTNLPEQRQRLLLERGQPTATLTTSNWPDTQRHSAQPPPLNSGLDELAYVLFTSGSTGIPKGVACDHRGVVNLLEDIAARQPLQAGERYSLWTSIGFDVSVYELFAALTSGGALHIVPAHLRSDAGRMYAWLCDQHIASAYLPPFVLNDIASLSASRPGTLTLKRLLVGVEPIPLSTLVQLGQANPQLHIINGYGPTETTICATLYSVPDASPDERRTPIGQAVRNNRLYVLDSFAQPVPPGVSGELYIGGHGLARGYLNQPDLTAERFVRDPFDTHADARLFRTGDLVRYLPDGALEFVGRVDHQLKIQGHRVEPGEIERELLKHPEVREALVITRDVTGSRLLIAYLVSRGPLPLETSEWFERLYPVLPAYMIPSAYVTLDAFPLSASGKIDRAALPAPELQRPPQEAGTSTPLTPLESTIAGIWSEVLGVDTIGRNDHFIDLGGESIQALQIVADAHDRGIIFTPRDLFECATVAALAKRVQSDDAPMVQKPTAIRSTGSDLHVAATKAGLSATDLGNLLADYGEE